MFSVVVSVLSGKQTQRVRVPLARSLGSVANCIAVMRFATAQMKKTTAGGKYFCNFRSLLAQIDPHRVRGLDNDGLGRY